MTKERKRYIELTLLIIIDIFSIFLIFLLAYFIRKYIQPLVFPFELPDINTMNFNHILWIMLIWLFFIYYNGLYTKSLSFWDELNALWKVVFFSTIGSFTIIFIGKISDEISRSILLLAGAVALPVMPLTRTNFQKFLRRFGLFKRRVLIIGSGELAQLTLKALNREPHFGYEVVGFIDNHVTDRRSIEGIKIHNGIDKIERYLARSRISDVFIALPELERERIEQIINKIHLKVERILLIPALKSIPLIGMELHHFFHEQILFLEIKSNLIRPHNIFFKRAFDIFACIILLIVFLIPMIIISIIITLTSWCNPIFTQCRVGRNGKLFKMYKFRTMHKDAEKILKEMLDKDEKLRSEWETYWKLKRDPRVTKIGSFLRKTSLDELPQLFNILKGEMSLVGPRPYLPEEAKDIQSEMATIWNVLPGITGLWQTSGRSNTSNHYRIAIDLWYVRNWSFWLDIVILFRTVQVVIKGEGAY